MNSALYNHLWQSTLFAIAAAGVAFLLRNQRANVRYWIWLAASLKFLVPFSVLMLAGARFQPIERATPKAPTVP
jgi:bla regulator protein BlaR1